MNTTTIMIAQQQVLRAITAARASVQAAVGLLQAAIQQSGAGGNVTLTADAIQAVLVRLQAAAQSLAAISAQQMQMVSVVVGGVDVTAAQNQIIQAVAAAAAAVNAQIAAFQRLLTQAQTMGGAVVISQAAAQMLLVSLQSVAESLVMLEARQQQLVNITTTSGGGTTPTTPTTTPTFPTFPGFPGFPSNIFGGGALSGAFSGLTGQQQQGTTFGNI